MTSNPVVGDEVCRVGGVVLAESHKGKNIRAGAAYRGLSSQYKGPGAPVMDGSG